MPRVRRRGHKVKNQYGDLTRAELIRTLINDALPPDVGSPILAGVPKGERAARRRPILIERLAIWQAEAWGSIFAEQPALEEMLTVAQGERWQDWRTGVERRQKHELQSNVRLMKAN